jgi:hypothetical protein
MIPFIIYSIVNGRKVFTKQGLNFENNSFCYFTENENEFCQIESKTKGKIILGKDFLTQPFF